MRVVVEDGRRVLRRRGVCSIRVVATYLPRLGAVAVDDELDLPEGCTLAPTSFVDVIRVIPGGAAQSATPRP